MFSGIVLNFSRLYRPGDWISIDGNTDGRVLEINWRATNVLTANQDLAIVPNSTIAKAKIVNASSPSGTHGTTMSVQLNAKTPPETGAEVLQRAILNTRPILANPAPLVAVKSITGDATQFDIKFFVDKPGDLLGSLFAIGAGVVSVTRVSSEGEIELMRIGPGDHFGEIGLLTGAASKLTLKALTPVTTYELAKEHLAPVIDARPDFSDELCHVLAQYQAIGRLVATDEIDKPASKRPGGLVFRSATSPGRLRQRSMSSAARRLMVAAKTAVRLVLAKKPRAAA